MRRIIEWWKAWRARRQRIKRARLVGNSIALGTLNMKDARRILGEE